MADEEKKKKGLLDKAIDALTDRDEKAAAAEAAEAAAAAAQKAKADAAIAESKRKIAEARAEAAENKAKEAEEKAVAEKRAAAAKEHAERIREQLEEQRAAAQAAKEEAEKRTYVVKSGDSLSKIAKEMLGDASRWPEIFELNKDIIKNPNLIYPNQELKLPK